MAHLKSILGQDPKARVLIFCETKRNCDSITRRCVGAGKGGPLLRGMAACVRGGACRASCRLQLDSCPRVAGGAGSLLLNKPPPPSALRRTACAPTAGRPWRCTATRRSRSATGCWRSSRAAATRSCWRPTWRHGASVGFGRCASAWAGGPAGGRGQGRPCPPFCSPGRVHSAQLHACIARHGARHVHAGCRCCQAPHAARGTAQRPPRALQLPCSCASSRSCIGCGGARRHRCHAHARRAASAARAVRPRGYLCGSRCWCRLVRRGAVQRGVAWRGEQAGGLAVSGRAAHDVLCPRCLRQGGWAEWRGAAAVTAAAAALLLVLLPLALLLLPLALLLPPSCMDTCHPTLHPAACSTPAVLCHADLCTRPACCTVPRPPSPGVVAPCARCCPLHGPPPHRRQGHPGGHQL